MKTANIKIPVQKVKKTNSVSRPAPVSNAGQNSNTMNKAGLRPQHQAQPLVPMRSMAGGGGDQRVAASMGLNVNHAADIMRGRQAKRAQQKKAAGY